jgi:hypothetical protein
MSEQTCRWSVARLAYVAGCVLAAGGCDSSVQLQGDQGGSDEGIDATDDDFDAPDTPDEPEARDLGDWAETTDGDAEGGADADGEIEDAPDETAHPDAWDVIEVVVPDERERFVTSATGEAVNLHRSAMPAAYSGSVYGLLLEATGAPGTPGPIAAYVLDPDAGTLTAAWADDAPSRTDYNSICWSGSTFVAALPTPAVGVRVLAFGADGSVASGPSVLEADADYSPAGEGYPPVLVCPRTGPLFIDRGRGPGGGDRVYLLGLDGTYSGAHVDLDVPDVITNMFLAYSPCVGTTNEAACATDGGLAFVNSAGSLYSSGAAGPMPPCADIYGCDVGWSGSELVVAGTPLAGSAQELRFARFTDSGELLLPTVVVPDALPAGGFGVRVASSGATLAILTGSIDAGMSGSAAMLHVQDAGGAWRAPALPVAACTSPGSACGFHIYGGGAAIFWDGTQFVALWLTDLEPAVAIRAFRVVP